MDGFRLCFGHAASRAYPEGSDVGVRGTVRSRMALICDMGYLEILFTELGKTWRGKRQ